MAVLPIRTDRLLLRVMHPDDAAVLAAYRNDPDVARYQDWPVPFTLADAERVLGGQAHLDDLDPEGWTQVAIERDGEVVGDLGIRLETSAGSATLGYTIAPAAQHQGFAVEAAGAAIDAVFERTKTWRIVATADDANRASMRVIEPLGFRFEGVARKAALVRGAWVDDVQFAITRDDRAAWVSRVRTPPERVELVELVHETALPYAQLVTHHFQEYFVSPVAVTFRHALLPEEVDGARVVPWFRGITADGDPVGFLMLALATETFPDPYLWRLLIDRWHQRRGIGERVMSMLIEQLRDEGHERLMLSWGEGPGSPALFYRSIGFEPTGNMIDDEIEAALVL
ncbi:MAG: GNAT family N-acetyltransferase [Ilumatobacteraceae bacterium]